MLEAELDELVERLQSEGRVPNVSLASGDFLDVAQDVEHQELARLSASRLSERARRVQIALNRAATGEYGVCSECGSSIPPKRLRALPETTTCVGCQDRLERVTHH